MLGSGFGGLDRGVGSLSFHIPPVWDDFRRDVAGGVLLRLRMSAYVGFVGCGFVVGVFSPVARWGIVGVVCGPGGWGIVLKRTMELILLQICLTALFSLTSRFTLMSF